MRTRIDRTKVKVRKHHRTVDVFTDGRYLHVSMKISRRSTKGRQLARETATEILNVVGSNEAAYDLMQLNIERMAKGEAVEKAEGAVIPMHGD